LSFSAQTIFQIFFGKNVPDNISSASVARKSGHLFLLYSVALILGIATNFTLVKVAGLDAYGGYVYVFNLLYLLLPLCSFGTETLLLRYVALYDGTGDYSRLKGLLIFAACITLVAVTIVCIFSGFAVTGFNLLNFKTGINWIYISFPCLMMLCIGLINQSSLQALTKLKSSQLAEKVIRPVVLLVVPIAIFLTAGHVNTDELIITNLAAIAAGMVISVLLFRKAVARKTGTIPARFELAAWFVAAATFLSISVLSMLNSKVDVFILGLFRNNTEVAVYNIALRVSELVSLPLHIVNLVLAPLIVRLHAGRNHDQLQQLLTTTSRGVLFIGGLIVLTVCLTGNLILNFLRIDSEGSYAALIVLCIGQLINIASGSVGMLLMLTGNQRYSVLCLITSAFINICLNYILTPRFGFLGTAISTATATAVWNFMMYYFVRRKLSLKTTAFKFL